MALSKSDVASIHKAKNGRWFAKLKTGKTQFLSDDDAKRLKGKASTASPKGKGTKKAKKKGGKKSKGTKSTTTSNNTTTTTRKKVKQYLGDFF